jgi:hypothetical protein
MDNIQKGALIALVAVAVVIPVYIINTVNTEQARVDAEQQAVEEHDIMCSNWSLRHEDELADINARQDSLGGQLDLDGRMTSDVDQYNLDVDRYNLERAGIEANFYEENG